MSQEINELLKENAGLNFKDLEARIRHLERLATTDSDMVNLNSYNYDAGGRQRVSLLTTLGDYRLLHADNALLWDEEIIGTATSTYTSSKKAMVMTTSATSDAVIRQTKQWHNYQSGKSHYVEWTFQDLTAETNITKRSGYFSTNTTTPFNSDRDGIYLESSGGSVYLKVDKAGSNVFTSTPITGVDFSKFTIAIVDFLWLGGSAVRLWMIQDGEIALEKSYPHAGNVANVMMESPNQPIRYEIRQDGAGSGTFDAICSQVSSEGAQNEIGVSVSIDNAVTAVSASAAGTIYGLKAYRLQSARRNIITCIRNISLINTSNNRDFKVMLLLNPTVATGSLSFSDVSNMSIQEATGGATFTGGHQVFSAYSGQSLPLESPVTSALNVGSTIGGTMDIMALAVQGVTNNQTFVGSIGLLEFS